MPLSREIRLLALATLLPLAAVAASDVSSTVRQAESAPLEKVGEATLDFMFWSVYNARLYCPAGAYEPGTRPLRLEVEYLIAIKSKNLVKRTAKEWDALGVSHPAQKDWLASLTELWPDVQRNDVLALEIDEDERATFFMNGERLGVVDDAAFGQHFIDIWLSPQTTRPALRLALTGDSGGA